MAPRWVLPIGAPHADVARVGGEIQGVEARSPTRAEEWRVGPSDLTLLRTLTTYS